MKNILLIALLFCNLLAHAEESDTSLQIAPQWTLYTEDNIAVSSQDFAGQPLIIHFWATWCPYCKKLQPGLDRLYKKYHGKGLQLIAISYWEDDGAKPQASLEQRGHSFRTVVKGDHVARTLFEVEGTPTTVFINKSGQIIAKTRISNPDDPRLEKIVQLMLAE